MTETPTELAADRPERVTRRRYKIRGPETWALVREGHLAGASGRKLAARYDVTEWAIRRRAGREGWTKRARGEATPPPALEPLTPAGPTFAGSDGAPDARTLMRRALAGLDEALRQGRLAEARNLAQIAGSLERLGAAGVGGGFTLDDMVRVIFDTDWQTELMTVDRDGDNPPEKLTYWKLNAARQIGTCRSIAEDRNRHYALGRAEMRVELGLPEEIDRPDVWEARGVSFVRLTPEPG